MLITSLENQKVKDLVRLQQKKYRDLTGTYLVEGEHLVEEAYQNHVLLEVFVLEGVTVSFDGNVTEVKEEVMKKISSLESPPSMVGVCRKQESHEIFGNHILLLDGIQDPGNLGTMIRSSLAFDVSTIVLSPDCVDVYNPKVLRGTQGMIFAIPIVSMPLEKAISSLREKGIPIYGTSVEEGVDVSTLDTTEKEKYALVMGNEGRGISSEVFALCDKNLYISMNSKVESLNVGVACSILLYELGR
ncbi:MAG: RNA methyltransferase [Bacilli bacterium]|nr:RNA methyltransferase [Bacilli bacterium]